MKKNLTPTELSEILQAPSRRSCSRSHDHHMTLSLHWPAHVGASADVPFGASRGQIAMRSTTPEEGCSEHPQTLRTRAVRKDYGSVKESSPGVAIFFRTLPLRWYIMNLGGIASLSTRRSVMKPALEPYRVCTTPGTAMAAAHPETTTHAGPQGLAHLRSPGSAALCGFRHTRRHELGGL
jgi:hypothetical protein